LWKGRRLEGCGVKIDILDILMPLNGSRTGCNFHRLYGRRGLTVALLMMKTARNKLDIQNYAPWI
jgi:hypothetical protein